MLQPFQWAVLTVDEARLLMKFIETSTATPKDPRNYEKMHKAGVMEMYDRLREFVEMADHYESRLRYFNPDDYQRDYNE